MFDLLEENLSDSPRTEKPSEEKNSALQSLDPFVYSMPERFRAHDKKGVPPAVMIGGGIFLLLALGGTVAALFLLKAPASITSKDTPKESLASQGQAASPQAALTPSSTSAEFTSSTTLELATPVTRAETPSSTEQAVLPGQTPVLQLASSSATVAGTSVSSTESVQGVDSDADELTESEEHLFSTNAGSADTDNDGFPDGREVQGLYDPTKGSGAKLSSSNLVNTYTNQTYHYSLLYPSSWIAKAIDASDKEVLLSSATGEFFTIRVDANDQKELPETLKQNLSPLGGATWKGGVTQDSLTALVVPTDERGVVLRAEAYTFSYNLNTKQEINFLSTFKMMVKSLTFTGK